MQDKLFDLEGKVVVITGGAGVLGSSMAAYLAAQKARLVILDLQPAQATAKAAELGGDALGFGCNVLEEQSMAEVATAIHSACGRIDVLINAAGGNMPGATVPPDKTVFEVSVNDLRKVLDLNLMGSVIPTLALGKLMANQGKGSIINISSMAASRTLSRVLGYSLAKSGIDIFTKWMAHELASKFGDKLRVNAIAPGFFIGNQNRALLTNADGSYTERGQTIIKNTPMGRFGEADELHGAIHYLASDASQFVTGTIIPIDGGFSSFSGV